MVWGFSSDGARSAAMWTVGQVLAVMGLKLLPFPQTMTSRGVLAIGDTASKSFLSHWSGTTR